jgi:polysaccharide export outer membrane protein
MAAISQAEGLTADADTVIEIRHPPAPLMAAGDPNGGAAAFASFRPGEAYPPPSARTLRIDLEQASLSGQADMHLEDGSTVMVMQRPKRYIHVMGLVRAADQFEMPPDHELRVLDAIALANGRTLELADKVRVIRTVPNHPEPIVIEVSVRDAKLNTASNIRLAPGDVVSVEETPVTFVVGTIREFIRFGFSAAIPGL